MEADFAVYLGTGTDSMRHMYWGTMNLSKYTQLFEKKKTILALNNGGHDSTERTI